MQISKLSAIALLASAIVLPMRSRAASPESEGKALELLRNTIAEERQRPAEIISAPTKPVPAGQQEQALELLRRTMAADSKAPAAPVANKASAGPAKPAKSNAAKTLPTAVDSSVPSSQKSDSAHAAASGDGASLTPAGGQTSGPKTKQQRLMDLLELYRADKLTPAQYHAERAKIVAEP